MARVRCRIAGTGGYLEYSGIGDGGKFLLDVGFGLRLGFGEMSATAKVLEGRGGDRVTNAVDNGISRCRMALSAIPSSTFSCLPPFLTAHEAVDDTRAAPLAQGANS